MRLGGREKSRFLLVEIFTNEKGGDSLRRDRRKGIIIRFNEVFRFLVEPRLRYPSLCSHVHPQWPPEHLCPSLRLSRKEREMERHYDERSLSDLIQRRTMTSTNSASTQIRGQEFAIGNRFVNLKYLASGTYGMVV